MSEFPRTTIEDASLSRLMIGTNWFMGFSHTSRAKDNHINEHMTSRRIADVLEAFMTAGVDTLYGHSPAPKMIDAIKDAEDRTGRKCYKIAIPTLNIGPGPDARAETERILDQYAALDLTICMPHQATTDALVDRRARCIRDGEMYMQMIRQRGMIPGLSTHMPETPIYADEGALDAATYVQIYNAAGFLMQIEVDWVHRMIWQRAKPVITIKPLAAGRLHPLVGLAFSWATLRDCDAIAVGTMTPDEARELVDISLSILARRGSDVELQRTRSKASIDGR